jgi:hypothetical protein
VPYQPQAIINLPKQKSNMAEATTSHTKSALADLCTSSTTMPDHKAKDHDSHASTQQPFRFMDLPPELRDMIYTFAFSPGTEDTRDGKFSAEPQLTAGLSESATARALSQVCRTVRQESMKTYCSETTFVVRKLPDRVSARIRRWTDGGNPAAPGPDPLDVWARTWGEFGAQHIRSLYISPLEGTVRISMADKANPVSFDEGACANLSASALESAGVKAFGRRGGGTITARKIETLLHELGDVWHLAWRKKALTEISVKYSNAQVSIAAEILEEALTG